MEQPPQTFVHRARTWAYWNEVGFALLVAVVVWPIWAVSYVPLVDLPQHMAISRIVHSFSNPQFRFEDYFTVNLLGSPYGLYYMAVDLVSYVVDVEIAARLVVTAIVIAIPYSIRSLLRALGSSDWLALFALPLTYNAPLMWGFLSYVMGFPFFFGGLAIAVRQRESFSVGRFIKLFLLSLLMWQIHFGTFGMLLMGVGLLSLSPSPRTFLLRLAPVLPAAFLSLVWGRIRSSGQHASDAILQIFQRSAGFRSIEQQRDWFLEWMTDVFVGPFDELVFTCWALLVVVAVMLGRKAKERPQRIAQMWIGVLALALVSLYLLLPTKSDYLWAIAERFPIVAAFLVPCVVPPLPKRQGRVIAFFLVALTFAQSAIALHSFRGFQTEIGDLEAALEHIPDGKRVANLNWGQSSDYLMLDAHRHMSAYYQVRKGGVLMDSFAHIRHMPVVYKKRVGRAPRVPWERPDLATTSGPLRLFDYSKRIAWYDFVLSRDGPDEFTTDRIHMERVFEGKRWSVWKHAE